MAVKNRTIVLPTTRGAAPAAPAAPASVSRTDLVAAAEAILARRQSARAPAVHTQDRQSRYTREDYDLMALDNGASREGIERRRATNEDARRGAPPARGARAGASSDPVRKRQFAEMRGTRRTSGSRAGEADLGSNPAGLLAAGYIAYMAMADGDGRRAYQIAREHGASALMLRTLGESTLVSGGALIPEIVSEDYIELLYATTVYLQGNPMRLDAPGGNLTLPKIQAGAGGGWVGENQNVVKSSPSFSQVKADLKYLGVLCPVSNRLMRHSPSSVEMIVREDLVNNAAVLIDTAAIRGTGSVHQPKGLRQTAAAANVFAQTGSTVAAISTDTAKMQRLLEDAKIKFVRGYWMMSPRTRWTLMSLRDGNNNLVYAEEMGRGEFQGRPFGVTQSIPVTLGGGSDTELYLVDMIHQVFAEGVGDDALRVVAQDGAAYHDGSAVVAGFSQDQTVVRLIQSCDVVSRQDGNEIAILTGVTY